MLRILSILLVAVALGACALTPSVYDPHRQVLAALRWPKLATPSPDQASEIRLWLGDGLVVPYHILRVRQQDSRVAAEIVRWWRNDTGVTFTESEMKGCRTLRNSRAVGVCVIPLPEALATTVASDLAALRVWELQERRLPEEGLFVVTADGEGLTVELRNADVYRRMHFVTSNEEDSTYDPQARLVADFVNRLVESIDSP